MNEVVVNLLLAGKRRFIAGIAESSAAMKSLGVTTDRTGKIMTHTTRRTWLMNQALFTLRRVLFGITIGFIGLGVVALKWGFDFNKSISDATAGFQGFGLTAEGIKKELKDLYFIAATTPFDFPQILQTARRIQPFTDNLALTNQLVQDLTNSLSAVGTASGAFLTRATIQWTHIMGLGTVKMQQVNALARDQIQILPMLALHYHTTTAAISDMIRQGLVPASEATKALHEYQKTQIYLNKNLIMSTQSLTGSWATFKDLVGMAMGGAEKGLTSGIIKNLREIDQALIPMIKGGKPITLNMIIEALDKGLSPKTHLIINLFNFLYGVVQGVTGTLWLFFYIINKVAWMLEGFGLFTKSNALAMRAFGTVIGIAIAALAIWKTYLYTSALIQGLWNVKTKIGIALEKLKVWWTNRDTAANVVNNISSQQRLWNARRQIRVNQGLIVSQTEATASTNTWTASIWANTVALLSNPLTWIILGIVALVGGLVILYFKWQRFHDLVNSTAGKFQTLYYWITKVIDAGNKVNSVLDNVRNPGGSGRWWNKGLFQIAKEHLAGGTPNVTSPGAFLVGERGPEVVHLPRGAAVQPNHAMDWGGSGMVQVVIMPQDIKLDGRTLAEVTYKHRLDRLARR